MLKSWIFARRTSWPGFWARSKSNIPIPGFRNLKQAQENAGAIKFGPLAQEQMKEIDSLLAAV
ncbi:MAG: hypothetical protein GX027_01795 [Clostridiaceae bacterium]|nr:hypothetical protein [Clostridiaceae bacterium]